MINSIVLFIAWILGMIVIWCYVAWAKNRELQKRAYRQTPIRRKGKAKLRRIYRTDVNLKAIDKWNADFGHGQKGFFAYENKCWWQCTVCGKVFDRRWVAEMHYKKMHRNLGD